MIGSHDHCFPVSSAHGVASGNESDLNDTGQRKLWEVPIRLTDLIFCICHLFTSSGFKVVTRW